MITHGYKTDGVSVVRERREMPDPFDLMTPEEREAAVSSLRYAMEYEESERLRIEKEQRRKRLALHVDFGINRKRFSRTLNLSVPALRDVIGR